MTKPSLERIVWNNKINRDTHKEIIAKLDNDALSRPNCASQIKKYEFQKLSKIPYLETIGIPNRTPS